MHLPVQPVPRGFRLPRLRLSQVCAGDGASSCLASRILQHRLLQSARLPGLPASCCAFQMSDRVSPAHSSSDLPAMEIRVASPLASFGAALRPVSGFPVSRLPAALANAFSGLPQILHLPAAPAMEIQVAPSLASFSVAGAQLPGYPESCASSPAVLMRLRVAPNPASSGRADGEFLGRPASSALGLASLWFLGLPRLSTLWRLRLRVPGGHRFLPQRSGR